MNKTSLFTKIMLIVICVAVVGSLALSGITFAMALSNRNNQNNDDNNDDVVDDIDDPAQEDDVLIAETYLIQSTTQISDAYKSGDSSSLSDTDKETLDLASNIIDKYITSNMTDYEKELAIYDFLTTNLKPDSSALNVLDDYSESDNPHDVLKNGSAVCVGYATTFRMFMQMLDIECMVVHSSDLTHSWDLVKLDGDWYHVDCYSDQNSGNKRNFNMDDTMCMSLQTWNTDFFPAANGQKYNYLVLHATTLENASDVAAQIKNMWDERTLTGSFTLGADADSSQVDIVRAIVGNIADNFNQYVSNDNCYAESYELEVDGTIYMCLFITTYDSEIAVDLDEEQQAQVEQAITDAFGAYYEVWNYDEEVA